MRNKSERLGVGGNESGNNIRVNERDKYSQNVEPFLKEMEEIISERMDHMERMHRM